MYTGKTLFAQLMDFLPWSTFARIVTRYGGDQRIRTFPCTEHFRILAFAQLTYRESLRDIEACLGAQAAKLYHMGIRSPVKRATLADANERRDWRLYAEFAQRLITQARILYATEDLGLDVSNTVYALDSTTIDLCLALFPWAPFRATKAAVKLHTLLDLRGAIPSFIHISDGKLHDVNALDLLIPEPAAIYVMDRGYLDFERLFTLHQAGAFFVTRAKSNTDFRRIYSAPSDRAHGIVCDQTIALSGFYSHQHCPIHLRRIRFKDPETGKTLVFLTNLFAPPAATICALYKARWQVELFFKWIKQHLRIKKFLGTSENAVKTQIWTAVSVYVLVAIVKKRLNLDVSLYTLLQILSVTLFEKIPLNKDLFNAQHNLEDDALCNQLNLFDS
ncbi:MAG: IS4 family transposase [Nitrospirota bacterium]